MGSCTCPTYLLGGHTDVLVCPSRTITELNGWDAMNPGHFDQHLTPFYENDLKEGILTRAEAKELMSCFFIKINNQTAPPKVGITAKERASTMTLPI